MSLAHTIFAFLPILSECHGGRRCTLPPNPPPALLIITSIQVSTFPSLQLCFYHVHLSIYLSISGGPATGFSRQVLDCLRKFKGLPRFFLGFLYNNQKNSQVFSLGFKKTKAVFQFSCFFLKKTPHVPSFSPVFEESWMVFKVFTPVFARFLQNTKDISIVFLSFFCRVRFLKSQTSIQVSTFPSPCLFKSLPFYLCVCPTTGFSRDREVSDFLRQFKGFPRFFLGFL